MGPAALRCADFLQRLTRTPASWRPASPLHQVPFAADPEKGGDNGIVYVWQGAQASSADAQLAKEVADWRFQGHAGYTIRVLRTDEGPDRIFWGALGGQAAVPSFPAAADARMYRCSIIDGVFSAKEQLPQFCQDDLEEHTVALLVGKGSVSVWVGVLASDVVQKLAAASAREWARRAGLNAQAAVATVAQGDEPIEFTSLFHAWGRFRVWQRARASPYDAGSAHCCVRHGGSFADHVLCRHHGRRAGRQIDRAVDLGRPLQLLDNLEDPFPPRPAANLRHPDSPFLVNTFPPVAAAAAEQPLVLSSLDGTPFPIRGWARPGAKIKVRAIAAAAAACAVLFCPPAPCYLNPCSLLDLPKSLLLAP